MAALGPLVETAGTGVKGVTWKPAGAVELPRAAPTGGCAAGSPTGGPALARDIHLAEAILALSGTTNGEVAVQGWQELEERTGVQLADLAEERAGERISFADTQVQPRAVITSPEWSGSETGGRRYSPFVVNVERKKPWHTLTGRMHFFLDHDWIAEYGECAAGLPAAAGLRRGTSATQGLGEEGRPEITVRYLTPHSKWSIHSEYQDNLHMLRLFRGGPVIWMSPADAAKIGVADNDWIEAYNRNGVVACRAVVTHRMPRGHGVHVPRQGPAPDDAEVGDLRLARRRRQLPDPAGRQADPHDRRLRASCPTGSTTTAPPATSATRSP